MQSGFSTPSRRVSLFVITPAALPKPTNHANSRSAILLRHPTTHSKDSRRIRDSGKHRFRLILNYGNFEPENYQSALGIPKIHRKMAGFVVFVSLGYIFVFHIDHE